MQKIVYLQHGKFYHIYNRGINSENIFFETCNYEYFIKLYENHINPIAETYAWCLLKNHFHFSVRIKDENEVGNLKAPRCPACDKEAIRVIKTMPAWKPGKQNGKDVSCFFNLPINFQLR